MTEIPSPERGRTAPRPLPLPRLGDARSLRDLVGRRSAETAKTPDLSPRLFRAGIAACTAGVAAFLFAQITAWPPHEDETLALFVGRQSLGGLFNTVLGQRGGAPLHFLLAWLVAHAGGGLTALRLLSALFAIASVPVIALLCERLTDRATALTATVIASASWVLLFHGVYGRMYSLFLFTSALSYLSLLVALDGGGRRRWSFWALSILLTLAVHPYGALVITSQGLFVLTSRKRLREAITAFAAVAVLAVPLWRADLVLAGRFDVGVGGGGAKLGGPLSVLRYLRGVAGDFSIGYGSGLLGVCALAIVGIGHLSRTRRQAAALAGCVFGTPTVALLLAKLGSSTSPESRHLIFALPFFSLLVAAGLVSSARTMPPALAGAAVAAAIAAIAPVEVAWAWHKTPALFHREPQLRVEAREAASAWLAKTTRRDDILFGYDPIFLGAWRRSPVVPRTVVPRADAKLALKVLRAQARPLGRAVFVFDRSDTNNYVRRLYIPLRYPEPRAAFDARSYGPFLVIRTKQPTRTVRGYLQAASAVQLVGLSLYLGDADVNYATVQRALHRLDGLP